MKTILLLLLAALLYLPCSGHAQDGQKPAPAADKARFKNVGPDEFDKLRADTNAVVLDVRTAKEFTTGHLPGATNIDWNAPDFAQRVSALDKNKVYLVHCAVGRRSAAACGRLSAMDFPKLYNLEGGLTAWQKAGKPVEK